MHLKELTEQADEQHAKEAWTEIHQQMLDEFAEVKTKIADAVNRNDENDRTIYMEVYKKQLNAYTAVWKQKNSLVPYNASLFELLANYANELM